MSSSIPPIPADTRNAAKAIYSTDNYFLVVGDRLDVLLGDVRQNGFHPTELTSRREKPSLVIITIFQFIEKLSDDQAAEATRVRVDWKYALHLSINYLGLPATLLCQYRQWVLQEPARQQSFQLILDRLSANSLLVGYQNQPVETSSVVDEVCSVTRLDMIFKAMQYAIGTLATRQPEWLRKVASPHWYERYHRLSTTFKIPNTTEERVALARSYGADAKSLLEAYRESPPRGTAPLDVLALEDVLKRHFEIMNDDLSWRKDSCLNCQK